MKGVKESTTVQWLAWWRDTRWRTDLVLALALGVIEIVSTSLAGAHEPSQRTPDSVAFGLIATGAASLTFRRYYPITALTFVKGITLLYVVLGYPPGPIFLSLIVALFTAVMKGHRLIAWAQLAVGFVLFPWLPHFLGYRPEPTFFEILALGGWLLVLATVAEIARFRQQRAAQAARAREAEARRRADEERLRIARDLHDVLGHHISLISVQAGVALHLIDQRPEQARVALSVINDASKEALRELRAVLDVLRRVDEKLPRSPSTGLSSLTDLVSRASDAGWQVHMEVACDLRKLPANVDGAAFRIAQEALTNVMRHAGKSASAVRVTCDEKEITLQIDNETSQAASNVGIGLGQGIRSMQERARALGGVVEAGPRAGGGFRVFARLPLDSADLMTSGESE